MAWRRLDDKPLSEPMMFSLPTHICVTRPQLVNKLTKYDDISSIKKAMIQWSPTYSSKEQQQWFGEQISLHMLALWIYRFPLTVIIWKSLWVSTISKFVFPLELAFNYLWWMCYHIWIVPTVLMISIGKHNLICEILKFDPFTFLRRCVFRLILECCKWSWWFPWNVLRPTIGEKLRCDMIWWSD